MPVLAGLCWTRFLEFNTNIPGTTLMLRAMAETNVEDTTTHPALLSDLNKRCRAAIVGAKDGVNGGLGALPGTSKTAPFRYEIEPVDRWQLYAVLAESFAGQPIVADCDCLSPLWAAFFWHAGCARVGVGISQPRTRPCCTGPTCSPAAKKRLCGHGMAHAYTVLGLEGLPKGLRALCVPFTMSGAAGAENIGAFDGSVLAGMPRPRPEFYGSGESAVRWLREE